LEVKSLIKKRDVKKHLQHKKNRGGNGPPKNKLLIPPKIWGVLALILFTIIEH
jgi:hypothetical protein